MLKSINLRDMDACIEAEARHETSKLMQLRLQFFLTISVYVQMSKFEAVKVPVSFCGLIVFDMKQFIVSAFKIIKFK
jgi:hypothetical protein